MSFRKTVNALENRKIAFNCCLKQGELVPAFAGEKLNDKFPYDAVFSAYSYAIKKYIVCTENSVLISDTPWGFEEVCGIHCVNPPFMIEIWEGGAETVIISGSNAVILKGSWVDKTDIGVSLSCGAMYCGRLFGADTYNGFVLRWSGKGGYTDWKGNLTGSGYLQLDPERGEIQDLIVYNGKLVAVREHGLTVLDMYGPPEDFSVRITDTDCDKIFKDTARIVCGKLYFCSVSGLKCFDGNKIISIETDFTVVVPFCSGVYGNKYLLSCIIRNPDADVVLCVDALNGEICIVYGHAKTIFVGDAAFFSDNEDLYYISEGGRYFFQSGAVDFGVGRLKTVTKIDVLGTADIRISNGKYTRYFKAVNGVVRPHMRGKSFIIEAEGESALKAVNVTAEVTDAV